MLRSFRRPLLVLGLFLLFSGAAFAADFTWNGGAATDDWQDAANWTLSVGVDDGTNGFPDGTDRALFSTAVTPTVTNLPASLAELSISDVGANVTLGGTLNATTLTISAGTLTTGNNLVSIGANAVVDGTLNAGGQAGASTTTIGGNLTGTGSATFGAANVNVGNGLNISALTATSGTTSVLANFTVGNLAPNGGNIDLSGSPTITVPLGGFNNLTTNGPTLGSAISVGGNLNLTGTLTTNGNNLTVTGNITAPGINNIDQSGGGSVTVGGTTTLNAGASAILLNDAANDFGGAVSLSVTGANDILVVDANTLELGAVSASQNFSIDFGGGAGDRLFQSAVLDVTGNLLVTANAADTDVELETQANVLDGGITFTNNGNIRDLGIRKNSGAATLPSFPNGLRDLYVDWNSGFTMPSLSVTGDITINAGAGVTQAAGGFQAAGLQLLGAGPYTFTDVANDLDVIAANITEALTFVDIDGLDVGTVKATSGITTTSDAVTLSTLNAPVGDRDMALLEPIDVANAAVTLDITGDLDGGPGVPDITAASVDLDATQGIGETNPIEIQGTTLVDAVVSGNGAIYIDNTPGAPAQLVQMEVIGTGPADYTQLGNFRLDVTRVRTTNGDIYIGNGAITDTNADISVDSAFGVVDANGGNTVRVAANGALYPTINSTANEVTGGNIELKGFQGIGQTTGAFDVLANDSLIIEGQDADVFVRSGADIPLDSATLAGHALRLDSLGSIEEHAADGAADIVAAGIDLNAATGIGAANQIEMSGVGTINADVSTAGAISLSNVASAPVTASSITTPSGNVTYNQTGGESLLVTTATTGAGSVTIANAGAGGNIALASSPTGAVAGTTTATITSSDGSITASSGTADLEVSAPTINLNAVNGNIGAVPGNQIDVSASTSVSANTSTGNGDIAITAPTGDLNLGLITTGSEAAGTVELIATTGSIQDGDAAVDIIAGDAILRANGEIGLTDGIETTIGTLDVETTLTPVPDPDRPDFVTIIDTTGITISRALLPDGGIRVDAAGDVTLTDIRINTDAGNNDVIVNTTAGGNIVVVSIVTPATSADAILTADGAVIASGAGPHVTADSSVFVANGGSVGSAGNALVVDADSVSADAAGSVYITNAGTRELEVEDSGGVSGITAGGEVVLLSTSADPRIVLNREVNAGGDVTMTATDVIDVNRRVRTTGGFITMSSAQVRVDDNIQTTTNDPVTVNGSIRVDDNHTISSAGGEIRIVGEINDQSAAAHTLSLSSPGGDVYIEGAIGRTTRPQSVSFAAERVIFTGAASAADDDIIVDQQMTFTGVTHARLEMQDSAALRLGAAAGDNTFIWPIDLYIDLPVGVTLTLQDNLEVQGRAVFYGGTTNLNGNTLRVSDDLAIFGTAYSASDPDWATTPNTRWEHPAQKVAAPAGFYYDPGTPYNAQLTLGGAGMVVDSDGNGLGNFYVNGTDLNPGLAWTLSLPDGSAASPSYSATDPIANMGEPWAIALYSTIANSDLTGLGWVAAATPSGFEQNNSVTDGGGNDTTGTGGSGAWDFTAPAIDSAQTVRDDTIRIRFTDDLRNTGNELTNATSGGERISFDSGAQRFDEFHVDNDGDDLLPITFVPSETDGLGNIVAGRALYLYEAGNRWNTDATGTSTGAARSTDESGTQQSRFVDIEIPKGMLFAANSRNFIRDYTAGGGGFFTGTTDEAPPTVVRVVAGRHDHDETVTALSAYEEYDGHNYFDIRYSEPVDIGGASAPVVFNANGETTNPEPDDSAVRRATPSFSSASDIGGYVHDAGGSGTVFVQGYFSYPGTFIGGSRDGIVSTSSIFRKNITGVTNHTDEHYVTIVVKGFRVSPSEEWVGYIENASDPDGQTISVPSNANITDLAGNPVLDSSLVEPANTVTIQAAATDLPAVYPAALDWDVDPPIVAPFQPGGNPTGFRELVTVESGGLAQYIDHLDIHFLGNQGDQGTYDPDTDHPTPEQEGVRFYSFEKALTDGALALGFAGDTTPPVLSAANTTTPSISSDVDNTIFVPGPIDRYDDGYIRINIDEAVLQYGTQSDLWFFYTPSPADVNASGIVTDHAGNLVRPLSQAGTIERQPPVFVGTLAIAGTDRVYVRFNEYVLGYDDGTGTQRALDDALIDPNEVFEIVDQMGNPVVGLTIAGIQLLQRSPVIADSASDMFLTLSGPVTPEGAVRWRLVPGPGPDRIEDPFTSPIASSESNRITDVALNVVQPSAAWNDIQREDLYGDEFQGIISANEFDGGGVLLQRTTRLQLTILDAVNYGLPVELYVDGNVPDRFISDQFGPEFWLPHASTLIAQPDTSIIETLPANTEASSYLPVEQNGGVADFVIPEDDAAISGGGRVDLVPSIAGVPAARLTDPNDPRSFEPFAFTIQPFVQQRSGVTILNNVIWPQRGDVTLLTYELQRAGVVTVQVFTLDGQLVSVLQRGRQAGGRQMVSWDGSNTSGQMVASGLYFIRVVGPDIDQIRKVVVAKE